LLSTQREEINVSINKAKNDGATPFSTACKNKHIEVVKLLLNDQRVDRNKVNEYSWTPFWSACKDGIESIEIVKLLVNDQRVDINKSARKGQISPFYIACYCQHVEIVEYILTSGREIDMSKIDAKGQIIFITDTVRKKRNEEIRFWESKKEFQQRKRNYGVILELLESFERNPDETRFKLRLKLGLSSKINLFISLFAFTFFFFSFFLLF